MKAQCWPRTWRSGVKLQDLDARTILGTKDHFLPVLEHRVLSEALGKTPAHIECGTIQIILCKRCLGWEG